MPLQEQAADRKRCAIELPQGQIFHHRHGANRGVGEWLFRKKGYALALQLAPRAPKWLAIDAHAAPLCIPLAGEHLNKLLLAIAGNTRDADDLARMNVEAYIENDGCAAVADHVQPAQFQIGAGVPQGL